MFEDKIESRESGIYWSKPLRKWGAVNTDDGEHIGYYKREQDAVAARKIAEVESLSNRSGPKQRLGSVELTPEQLDDLRIAFRCLIDTADRTTGMEAVHNEINDESIEWPDLMICYSKIKDPAESYNHFIGVTSRGLPPTTDKAVHLSPEELKEISSAILMIKEFHRDDRDKHRASDGEIGEAISGIALCDEILMKLSK